VPMGIAMMFEGRKGGIGKLSRPSVSHLDYASNASNTARECMRSRRQYLQCRIPAVESKLRMVSIISSSSISVPGESLRVQLSRLQELQLVETPSGSRDASGCGTKFHQIITLTLIMTLKDADPACRIRKTQQSERPTNGRQ